MLQTVSMQRAQVAAALCACPSCFWSVRTLQTWLSGRRCQRDPSKGQPTVLCVTGDGAPIVLGNGQWPRPTGGREQGPVAVSSHLAGWGEGGGGMPQPVAASPPPSQGPGSRCPPWPHPGPGKTSPTGSCNRKGPPRALYQARTAEQQ